MNNRSNLAEYSSKLPRLLRYDNSFYKHEPHTHTHTHSLSLTHTLSHTHTLSLTHTHSLSNAHTLTETHTHTHTHSNTHTLTHTNTYSLSLSYTRTYTHTHTDLESPPASTPNTRHGKGFAVVLLLSKAQAGHNVIEHPVFGVRDRPFRVFFGVCCVRLCGN